MNGTPRPPGAARRVLQRIALVAVAIVAGLALCEIVLRCLNFPADVGQEWLLLSDPVRKRVFDERTLMANPKFYDENHYRTEKGRKTIVALGDSFTVGHNVEPSETYLAVLQAILHENGIDPTIIDMGMGYSGNDQHLAILEHMVLPRVKPDIVVWQLCYNDFWDHVELSLYRIEGGSRLVRHGIDTNWLYLRERICRCLPGPLGILKRTYLFRLVMNATRSYRTSALPAEFENRPLEYGRRKARLFVDEMARLAKEHGFELVFVLVDPQSIHLAREGEKALPCLEWTRGCYEAQKAMVSGRENYIDTEFSPDDLPEVNARFSTHITSVGHGLFLDADHDGAELGVRHYNKYGYWLFARKIARFLCAHRAEWFD